MKKALLFLFFIPVLAICQLPEPVPNSYVSDYLNKLTAAQVKALNDSIYAIEKLSSVQIAIVITDKKPEGMDMGEFANEIGRKWHVGNAQNGIVYVAYLSKNQKHLDQFISPASAIEKNITDLESGSICKSIVPHIRAGNYFGGMLELLSGINTAIQPAIPEQLALGQAELNKKEAEFTGSLWFFIGILFACMAIIAFFVWRAYQSAKKQEMQEQEDRKKRLRDYYASPEQFTYQTGQRDIRLKSQQSIGRPQRNKDVIPPVTIIGPADDDSPSIPYPSFEIKPDNDYGMFGSGSSNSNVDFTSGFDGAGGGLSVDL